MNEWKIVSFKKKRQENAADFESGVPPWRRLPPGAGSPINEIDSTNINRDETRVPEEEPQQDLISSRDNYRDSGVNLVEDKINEPCWFYNTIGCKNKDGTEKSDKDCKYLHIRSTNVKRPTHLVIKRPCDKYNLEGSCKWGECCKYSHKALDEQDWAKYYPNVSFSVRLNVQKRQVLENKLMELESRVKILEYKIKCIDECIDQYAEKFDLKI